MTKMKKVTVHVPATSANLGPGFDVLGIALHWFNDVSLDAEQVHVAAQRPHIGLSVHIEGEGVDTLPADESNLAVKAAFKIFERAKRWPRTLAVHLHNRIPLSRGMGSSSAAIIGGMCAANAVLGRPIRDEEILDLAVKMEGHPDNIVPAFAGGFCVSGIIHQAVRYLQFPAPPDLRALICSPDRPLATSAARRVLPGRIPFSTAVFTSSRVAFLVGSLVQKRFENLGFAMEDILHQPARAHLIPGLTEVIAEARKAGAYGAALSGAGSSVIAFTKPGPTTRRVGRAMQRAFHDKGVSSRVLDLALENKGVQYG